MRNNRHCGGDADRGVPAHQHGAVHRPGEQVVDQVADALLVEGLEPTSAAAPSRRPRTVGELRARGGDDQQRTRDLEIDPRKYYPPDVYREPLTKLDDPQEVDLLTMAQALGIDISKFLE